MTRKDEVRNWINNVFSLARFDTQRNTALERLEAQTEEEVIADWGIEPLISMACIKEKDRDFIVNVVDDEETA